MFLLYFILVSRWQVFYHRSKSHLRCLLWSEQEWVSIQENQFQNPVKCIKSISIWSTLFVPSTFITIIAIKLNSAIWDQVPAAVLHIHCARCFKAEERWGEMGIQKSGTERSALSRDRQQTHGRAAPPFQASCNSSIPQILFKNDPKPAQHSCVTSGGLQGCPHWGSIWEVNPWLGPSPWASWRTQGRAH